jgi:hypothetical protein
MRKPNWKLGNTKYGKYENTVRQRDGAGSAQRGFKLSLNRLLRSLLGFYPCNCMGTVGYED